MDHQYSSSAEAAKRLGVTPKALRLYEERGLVTPVRNASGWRFYGPDQMARLHQILVLKTLGLSLAHIGQLIAAGGDTMDSVLSLQERSLQKESEKVARALSLVRTARRKLAYGATLSIDDLATLNVEATALTPYFEKYFTEHELAEFMDHDHREQEEHLSAWHELFAELEELAGKGDFHSLAALDLGRRWMAQSQLFTRGDTRLGNQLRAMAADAMADPDTSEKLPISREMYDCITKIIDALNGDGLHRSSFQSKANDHG